MNRVSLSVSHGHERILDLSLYPTHLLGVSAVSQSVIQLPQHNRPYPCREQKRGRVPKEKGRLRVCVCLWEKVCAGHIWATWEQSVRYGSLSLSLHSRVWSFSMRAGKILLLKNNCRAEEKNLGANISRTHRSKVGARRRVIFKCECRVLSEKFTKLDHPNQCFLPWNKENRTRN